MSVSDTVGGMDNPVPKIFERAGGVSAVSRLLPGVPLSTVRYWYDAGNIPTWRRAVVLRALSGVALEESEVAYLSAGIDASRLVLTSDPPTPNAAAE